MLFRRLERYHLAGFRALVLAQDPAVNATGNALKSLFDIMEECGREVPGSTLGLKPLLEELFRSLGYTELDSSRTATIPCLISWGNLGTTQRSGAF